MGPQTARALHAINLRFYRTRAEAFSARRQRPWAGWKQLGVAFPSAPSRVLRVLDVGCGNGRFGAFLARHMDPPPRYLGVDASGPLLERCRARRDLPPGAELLERDVVADPAALRRGPFDAIALFGVLHHVPGEATRRQLMATLSARLEAGGSLALSLWRFGTQPRFQRLAVPWHRVGIDPGDLEPGDTLLSFAGDASVPRYCHHIDEGEAERLLAGLPLEPLESFLADGPRGDLNDYRLLRKIG